MAITLEANYSKKIGLPGYSSHQYLLTLRTELSDFSQVSAESQRLHALLQASVDREIQQPGWLPSGVARRTATTASPTRVTATATVTARRATATAMVTAKQWNCTPKQQQLIIKIVDENRLDKQDTEWLAMDRFGKGVKQLNKLEASGFIEELFERHPRQRSGDGHQPQRPGYAVR